jgi:uncharacterized protein
MVPAATANDYDTAIPLGVREIGQVIGADAGVTLNYGEQQHTYRRQPVEQQQIHLSPLQVLLGGIVIVVILGILIKTGNIGMIFFLLANIMGGGGGGRGGGRDDDRGGGGGFGGFGGGSSGGGGASGDF